MVNTEHDKNQRFHNIGLKCWPIPKFLHWENPPPDGYITLYYQFKSFLPGKSEKRSHILDGIPGSLTVYQSLPRNKRPYLGRTSLKKWRSNFSTRPGASSLRASWPPIWPNTSRPYPGAEFFRRLRGEKGGFGSVSFSGTWGFRLLFLGFSHGFPYICWVFPYIFQVVHHIFLSLTMVFFPFSEFSPRFSEVFATFSSFFSDVFLRKVHQAIIRFKAAINYTESDAQDGDGRYLFVKKRCGIPRGKLNIDYR